MGVAGRGSPDPTYSLKIVLAAYPVEPEDDELDEVMGVVEEPEEETNNKTL